jgi:hypothetical protein
MVWIIERRESRQLEVVIQIVKLHVLSILICQVAAADMDTGGRNWYCIITYAVSTQGSHDR